MSSSENRYKDQNQSGTVGGSDRRNSKARLIFPAFRYLINNKLASLPRGGRSSPGRALANVHRSRTRNLDEVGWRSENVDGLVSLPVVHGALPLDVPVLVIYGREGEDIRNEGEVAPPRRTSNHPSGPLSGLGRGDLPNEAQTLIFRPGVSGSKEDRHQGHASYTELFLSTGRHVWWAQTGGTAKMKHRPESAERRLTEARVPRPRRLDPDQSGRGVL